MKCHTLVQTSFDVWRQQLKLEDEAKEGNADQAADSSASRTAAEDIPVAELAESFDQPGESPEVLATSATADEPAADSSAADKSDQSPLGPEDLEIPSVELKKLYRFLALDDQLQPIPGETPKSIPWVRVHNLPDYVYFDHRAHVAAGVTCQDCHGPVEAMQRMEQFASLSMGWCVNCHRDATKDGVHGHVVHASTDCAVCHY
jgi:hypothetical protein